MKNIFITIMAMIAASVCGQTSISNGMSGKNVRDAINSNFDTLYNQKSSYYNVLDFGAVGDGVTDDQSAFQEALDSAFVYEKILFIPTAKYFIGSALVLSNSSDSLKTLTIEGNSSTILTQLNNSERLLTIAGSKGEYDTLSTGITEGSNWFICNDIASSLSPGDLIKVISTQPFNDSITYYNEANGRGEMKIVRNVVDSFIYVTEPFFDTYSTDPWYDGRDTALNWKTPYVQVCKVYPVRLKINGLTLRNSPGDYSNTRTMGLRLQYLIDSKINTNIYNFIDYGITALHCYNSHFDVNIYNTPRSSSDSDSPGYGFALFGSSMGCKITGNISNARHCFSYNCGSGGGVGWNNTVSINAYTGRENPMIDCHGPCGSIYIENCHLFGGNTISVDSSLVTTDPAADWDNRSRGIEVGAKYNYISNCNFYNVDYIAISTRANSEVKDLIIKDVVGKNSGLLFFLRAQSENTESSIQNIIIDGASGSFIGSITGAYDTVDTFYKGEQLTISNVSGAISGFKINDPDIKRLYLNNFNIDGDGADSALLKCRFIESIYLDNIKIKGWGVSPLDLYDVDNLYINNCVFDSTDSRIVDYTQPYGSGSYPNVDTIATNVSITNTMVINSIGATSNGLISMPDSSKIINLHFENNILDFNQYIMSGAEAGTDNLYIGNNQLPSNFVRWHLESNNFNIKYYANGGDRRIIGGNGSPESAIVAEPGAMYLREDGGAGTTLYIKESGTGNAGWVAK